MNPWKVILATIAIFLCGLVSGVLIVKTTTEPAHAPIAVEAPTPAPAVVAASNTASPSIVSLTNSVTVTKTNVVYNTFQAQRMAFIRQMVNRLHLDPDQKERITQIVKDSQERNKLLWQEIAPRMRDELKRVTDEIRGELRPAQLRRFNDLLRENRRDNHPNSGGPSTNSPPPAADKSTNTPEPPANSLSIGS
jgi:hypothetical protein